MNYIGGIEGMNFTPVSNYNQYLKTSDAFDVNSGNNFEAILNQQTQALQTPIQIQGGVEMNNFADIMNQANVQAAAPSDSAEHFLNSFSSAVGGGLNSVNEKMDAANKAQEAFAMGEDVSVHDVMIASEKATLSFQMAMQLRNKLMNAYAELNNIKV